MPAMSKDEAAGGIASIAHTALHAVRAGLSRSLPALRVVNQEGGFDCPGCAWPESAERGAIEFCENGAKAVAHEATTRTLGREFWLSWPVSKLREQPHRWLEAQGRLAEPLHLRPGTDRFEPVSWSEAFARAGEALRSLGSPDQAVFYTSGRASNEAAFLYQLFVREYGTNNLPDCSNLCHESSGVGLGEMIGIGKGTVSLADFAVADLILVVGQNPGSNHPRMLTTLQEAARRGCRIVSVNPLRERGLVRFKHPQEAAGLLGSGTKLAERFVRVRVGGDIALLKGVMKELFVLDAERGGVLDRAFLAEHTTGFEGFAKALEAHAFAELEAGSGVPRREMRELAELYAASEHTIACWAMGLTQHRHGVGNVQELMNLLLLRGNIGRPGAGPCPVRGHSNVQGDRTMGIWERPRPAFLDALEREFGFAPPRHHGLSTVEAIRAMSAGRAQVFVALGGNFAVASPDSARVEQALARQTLTVHVATKLNRTHLLGREILLLPCLGRTERDVQRTGVQFVTVEDSMAQVHRSQGRLPPVAPGLASEPAIVAGLARATLGERSRVPWEELVTDYDRIRERIARVVPGCEDMNVRVRRPGGFTLPRPPAERVFETPSGRAELREVPLPRIEVPPGHLLLMTVRSHDQYNTTIYGDDDRYRGIHGDRRVVFVHPDDLRALGLAEGARVDVTSHVAEMGQELTRSIRGFRAVAYDVPRGCAAAYFPEANPLVPVEHHAEESLTPAYKSVIVSLSPAAA
jgi:molybdopterin-dependent oxidoreductase alpha subunit